MISTITCLTKNIIFKKLKENIQETNQFFAKRPEHYTSNTFHVIKFKHKRNYLHMTVNKCTNFVKFMLYHKKLQKFSKIIMLSVDKINIIIFFVKTNIKNIYYKNFTSLLDLKKF